jgi:hypothetical protein
VSAGDPGESDPVDLHALAPVDDHEVAPGRHRLHDQVVRLGIVLAWEVERAPGEYEAELDG